MAEPWCGRAQPGRIIDLFAGAGGWDEGLRELGYKTVGIDVDRWACATAHAAGHERIEADIAALDPEEFAPVWGLLGSPPCQAYSTAGKGLGRFDKERVIACAHELATGHDTRVEHLAACRDPRSLFTIEPLRWSMALRPRWLALEQVPAVAGLWSVFAELLGAHGYRCAVGVLSAECFGVPQVRKRVFLLGSLDGAVELPMPTHRSFDPRRHEPREDELHLPRWRSMAEALGWGEEPARLQTNENYFGNPEGRRRSLALPAYTVLSSSSTWHIEAAGEAGSRRPRRVAPKEDGRAPTPCARHEERMRGIEPPGGAPAWTHGRPATTLLGDPRVTAPGSWPRCGRQAEIVRGRPVRVSVEQASILQGFRHDYPWQGSRSQRFVQIGNAVAPPIAARVLAEAMRPTLGEAEGMAERAAAQRKGAAPLRETGCGGGRVAR